LLFSPILRYLQHVMPDIKSLTAAELAAQFKMWGEPAYRATQVLEWLYARRVTDWGAMSNLPKALREKLSATFSLNLLELVRKQGAPDATQKFLWRLADGAFIESVLIPANAALYGEASDRHTLCVSTQVGCAYGCKFCASGLDGFKRNLRPHEIVEQVLAVERWAAAESAQCSVFSVQSETGAQLNTEDWKLNTRFVDNLVLMGMGEPLANYEHLLRALRILNAPWGGGIGARKITISTSGLAPQIRRLADEPEQFRLAVSLHGATDAVRNRIMPVNRKFPLKELTAALDHYQARKGRMLTFEYILISGVNDALDQVKPLAALALRSRAKVNLIPYNRVEGLDWERPDDRVCEAFFKALLKAKVAATLRREKGGDIDAACGQLRLKTERALAEGGT
jgi:23S rRNA (adenine2503-C2)-methyltransferase